MIYVHQPTLFPIPLSAAPDVSTCSIIYTPKGRAREYARLACNVYKGCGHGCTYCYAPSATFKSPDEFYRPDSRGDSFLSRLRRDAAKYQAAGIMDQVLLSFTCDPYQPLDVELRITRETINILHGHGLNVCTLTKGGHRALRDLDLFGPHDAFATTLTCLNEAESLKWEPNAAPPAERIATIQEFHNSGVPTWVSLEPVLDPAVSLEIIRQTHEFVDLFKVGKLNYHTLANDIDWSSFARDAIQLLTGLGYHEIEADAAQDVRKGGKAFYIKRDLATYR